MFNNKKMPPIPHPLLFTFICLRRLFLLSHRQLLCPFRVLVFFPNNKSASVASAAVPMSGQVLTSALSKIEAPRIRASHSLKFLEIKKVGNMFQLSA